MLNMPKFPGSCAFCHVCVMWCILCYMACHPAWDKCLLSHSPVTCHIVCFVTCRGSCTWISASPSSRDGPFLPSSRPSSPPSIVSRCQKKASYLWKGTVRGRDMYLLFTCVVNLINMSVKWWTGQLIYDVCTVRTCLSRFDDRVAAPPQPPWFACLHLFGLNGSTPE